jgi:uncharacterized tellurite resistance protein B-like protein
MFEFDKLCREVEALDPAEYATIISAKTLKILPAIRALSTDGFDCAQTMLSFLIASVYADGKLDESEYLLLLPALKLFFGDDIDYAYAKKIVKAFGSEGKELKKVVNQMVDLIGEVDEELKADIITVCLLICAVDGKISLKEKRYIKQLIK